MYILSFLIVQHPPHQTFTTTHVKWDIQHTRHPPHRQCQTGTRYPTQTRSFFQYLICTRFIFKIIGYFGYRVFQKTMFLTWKMPFRSYKILTNIILYHLYLTKLYCHYFNVLWANCNGNLLHNFIIHMFPWVLYMLLWKVISVTKLKQDYQQCTIG